jgi:hypothetical protein
MGLDVDLTFDPILLQMNGWSELKRLPILRPDDAARTLLGF